MDKYLLAIQNLNKKEKPKGTLVVVVKWPQCASLLFGLFWNHCYCVGSLIFNRYTPKAVKTILGVCLKYK